MEVQRIKSGTVTIVIHDDYCKDKTKEDTDRIIQSITEEFRPYLQRKETA